MRRWIKVSKGTFVNIEYIKGISIYVGTESSPYYVEVNTYLTEGKTYTFKMRIVSDTKLTKDDLREKIENILIKDVFLELERDDEVTVIVIDLLKLLKKTLSEDESIVNVEIL